MPNKRKLRTSVAVALTLLVSACSHRGNSGTPVVHGDSVQAACSTAAASANYQALKPEGLPSEYRRDNFGVLEGALHDCKGQPISGATVIVQTPAMSGNRTAISDAEGRFRFVLFQDPAFQISIYDRCVSGGFGCDRGRLLLLHGPAPIRAGQALLLNLTIDMDSPLLQWRHTVDAVAPPVARRLGRLVTKVDRTGRVLSACESPIPSSETTPEPVPAPLRLLALQPLGSGRGTAIASYAGCKPDVFFGTEGQVNPSEVLGCERGAYVDALGIQQDLKIVAVGSCNDRAWIKRLMPSGVASDPSFEFEKSGRSDFFLSSKWSSSLQHVVIQDDGRIVAGGRDGRGHILLRVLANGVFDESFGERGIVVEPFQGPFHTGVLAVALDDAEKILVGVGGRTTAGLMRYDSAGRIDRSFGSAGAVDTDFREHALRIVPLAGGGFLVAGIIETARGWAVGARRYNGAGLNDATFGQSGVAVLPLRERSYPTSFDLAAYGGQILLVAVDELRDTAELRMITFDAEGRAVGEPIAIREPANAELKAARVALQSGSEAAEPVVHLIATTYLPAEAPN